MCALPAFLMIGSVSSYGYGNYGMPRHSHGERSTGVPSSEEDESKRSVAEKSSRKEEEEKVSNPQKLDKDEKEQVEKLKARDAEVRAHEQAHMAAAGSLAQGGPNYVFQTGPDGKQYAIGGNVKIDTSPGRTPEETARKAQQIRAAALAPADPSAQDLKVAASAASMETEAAANEAKKSDKPGQSAPDSKSTHNGEITTSRQISAASESDSQNADDSESPKQESEQRNAYRMQAAKLYQS